MGVVKNAAFAGLVVAAVFLACELSYRRPRKLGLDPRFVVNATLWAIAGGFVLSHVVVLFLYHPDLVLRNPMSLFMVGDQMSSFGGFIGGSLAAAVYLSLKGVSLLAYFDVALFGFAPAWILGRLGCTIAFDHPGRPTDFFLGLPDPSGIVRHNLGFYEMLWTIVITATLYSPGKLRPFPNFYFALVIFLYTPVRFFFDTLLIADPLYPGWTPGQYFSVAFFLFGPFIVLRQVRFPRSGRKNP